ncbi:GPW/gp25 family protein [Zymobacter palmae]|uniref:Phage baseplate assemblyprotein W n=1 Tax=Zymobacter palmae TaxID=33074 RepID=A0A348HI76_9GAMM|nr:GPW/gp25 family protein [Zymobacter palmae]BBG31328.1 phage baseplate assemblyprotein W [Zymobacter palmae]
MSMSKASGKALARRDSITQSIGDIVMTPIGTRLMRRDYGSIVPFLIDQPLNGLTQLRVASAIVDALARWESRVEISRIESLEQQGAHLQLQLRLHDVNAGQQYSETLSLASPS